MLSNSSKYALKGVLYLAMHSSMETKIMAKDLAQLINVPPAYIAKLLQDLARKNLIHSEKGPHGGFYLSEKNKKEPIIKFIYAIDGEDKLNNCLMGLDHCSHANPCPLHHIASPMRDELLLNLKKKNINDLVTDINNGISSLPL
jgi:Rrf2 family protein